MDTEIVMYLGWKEVKIMLKIEIKTGNAAFCDPFTGEPSEFDEAIECKRLLEDICRKLEDGVTSGNIIDINGNKVGQWSRQERDYMAYYSSPRKYENATGKRFTSNCPCIHRTGSVKGMVKLGFWDKDSDKVRHGNWIYQQP